jgi:integrase/recombinase XerD
MHRLREVPLPPQHLRRLEPFIDGLPTERTTDRIFVSLRLGPNSEYEPLAPNGVFQVVKDASRRAGRKKRVFPHLLRHSWMTEMLRNGMNPIQLSVIAGASVDVISEHYAHLTKDNADEAMLRVLTRSRH